MKTRKLFLVNIIIYFLFLLHISCDDNTTGSSIYPPDNDDKVTIDQGVWGNVWFWEGDFMPGAPSGKITPVMRVIFIYEPTSYAMVEPNTGTFFNKINTKLVATTFSNANGFYQMALAPGKYSLFVKEDGNYYANGDDGEHIQPAIVIENEVTKRQIDINYKSTW